MEFQVGEQRGQRCRGKKVQGVFDRYLKNMGAFREEESWETHTENKT